MRLTPTFGVGDSVADGGPSQRRQHVFCYAYLPNVSLFDNVTMLVIVAKIDTEVLATSYGLIFIK